MLGRDARRSDGRGDRRLPADSVRRGDQPIIAIALMLGFLRPCVASGNYDRHRQAVYVVTVLLLVLRAKPIGDAIAGLT
jgi:hypothetical protein